MTNKKAHFTRFYFEFHPNCIIFACKNKEFERNFSLSHVNNCYIVITAQQSLVISKSVDVSFHGQVINN